MLYYPSTVKERVIGTRAENGTTRTFATLTALYADNNEIIETKGFPKMTLYVAYIVGATETGNKLQIQIEGSPDGTNFYIFQNDEVSGGTSTLSSRVFEVAGTAGTEVAVDFPLDIGDPYVKISVKESGVSTNYGTVFVELVKLGK